MYERELTEGGVYQQHTCVDKFDNYDIDLLDYECNITPKNETSPYDYIHISCLRKSIDSYVRKSVLDYFNIPVDFPVVYVTRKVPFTSDFKCGFYLNTFKKFKSTYFNQTLETIKLAIGKNVDPPKQFSDLTKKIEKFEIIDNKIDAIKKYIMEKI